MSFESLHEMPGYQIRRLRQIAAAIFAETAGAFGVTGQQYTTLHALGDADMLEQGALCDILSLDRSTMATLLVRLEEKGLIRRATAAHDKRRRFVTLTARGRRVVDAMRPELAAVQERILAPLDPPDRIAFRRMLSRLVDAHSATAAAAHSDSDKEAS